MTFADSALAVPRDAFEARGVENGLRMERELTVRQRRFAAGIAGGLSRGAAYQAAYPGINMKKSTLDSVAKKAAKKPRVKAEIERLTLELLPAPEDMRAIYAHGLAVIIQLSITAEDARVRLRAAEWLCSEAEKREKLEAVQPPNQNQLDEIFSELHALYQRGPIQEVVEVGNEEEPQGALCGEVLEPPGESSAVEALWNRKGVEEAATTANVALRAGCDKEAPEGEDLEMLEPLMNGTATAAEASIIAGLSGSAPTVKLEWEAIPGYFPRRLRLVQRRG
jgi:hypothetical protein